MLPENYSEMLHQTVCRVKFTKTNGEMRDMECTLNEQYISAHSTYEKKTERTKAVNENTVSVFDVNKNEWRSFRKDSVTEFSNSKYKFETRFTN